MCSPLDMDCRLNDIHVNVVLNILIVDMGLVRSQTTAVLSIRCYPGMFYIVLVMSECWAVVQN